MNIIKKIIYTFFILSLLSISCKKDNQEKDRYSKQKDKNICFIKMFEGEVSVLDDNNKKINIEPGLKLNLNWIIKTGKNSIIELLVGNLQTVFIKENSELQIIQIFKNKEQEKSKLNLKKGTIFIDSKKLTIGSSFEVETKSITVGIRGTEFIVINEKNESKVFVKKGEVQVRKNIDFNSWEEIKNKDEKLYEDLKKAIEDETIIKENEKFEITENELNKESEEIKKSLKNIKVRLKKSEKIDFNDNDINNIKNRKKFHRKTKLTNEEMMIYLDKKSENVNTKNNKKNGKSHKKENFLENKTSDKFLLKEIKFLEKIHIFEINGNNQKFSKIVFKTVNNDIVFNRVRIIYEDKSDTVFSKNFTISKNQNGILPLNNSIAILKIKVTLTSKRNNSPTTHIFVYGIR